MDPVFAHWLAEQPPEIWHAVATEWGEWDGDLSPIEWIVEQPNCEKATSIAVFEAAEGIEWIEFPNREAVRLKYSFPSAVRCFDLCAMIIDRWHRGFYTRSTMGHCGLDPIYQKFEAQVDPAKRPWKVPEEMYEPSTQPYPTARQSEEMRNALAGLGFSVQGVRLKQSEV